MIRRIRGEDPRNLRELERAWMVPYDGPPTMFETLDYNQRKNRMKTMKTHYLGSIVAFKRARCKRDNIRFWTTEEQPDRLAKQEKMAADFAGPVDVIPVTTILGHAQQLLLRRVICQM